MRHLCGERLCRIFYFTTSPRARSARKMQSYRSVGTPAPVPTSRHTTVCPSRLPLAAFECRRGYFSTFRAHDMSYDPARFSFASLFWHGVACAGCAHPSRLESRVQSVSDCRYLLLSHVLSKLRTRLDCARGKKNQNGLRKISISLNFIPTHRASKW